MSLFAVYEEDNKLITINVDGIEVSLQAEDIRPEFDYDEWVAEMIERSGLNTKDVEFFVAKSKEEAIVQYNQK
mgnify:CR=1 FL=1